MQAALAELTQPARQVGDGLINVTAGVPCKISVPRRSAASHLRPGQEGSLRIAPILRVPSLLTEFRLDPTAIIAEAGLDPSLFENTEHIVPFAAVGRLLALCAERSACPHFGHLVGEQAGIEVLGLVGQLVGRAPDVGTALHQLILYLHLHDRGAVPALWISEDRALLAYVIFQPEIPGVEHFYDGAVAISYNILKTLCGPRFKALEVRLSRPRPADVEPYRRLYRCPINFGAEHSAVVFAASWLQQSSQRRRSATASTDLAEHRTPRRTGDGRPGREPAPSPAEDLDPGRRARRHLAGPYRTPVCAPSANAKSAADRRWERASRH